MGIVPDLSAIRAVKKHARLRSSKKKREYESAVPVGDVALSRKQIAEDTEALETIRRTEMQNLLENLVTEATDEPDVVIADATLVNEWRVQHIKASVEESAGSALKDALASTFSTSRKEKSSETHDDIQPISLSSVADSDGDVDVSTATALASSRGSGAVPDAEEKQVVYRDEDGRRITRARWLEIQASKKGGYKVKKDYAKDHSTRTVQPAVEWGVGIHQQRELECREKEERELEAQPFSRYDIDVKYDKELKEKVLWEDPLRHVSDSTQRESQSRGVRQLPSCRFAAPPNRFNIKPGYRWDGVIRGNGYEPRLLKERNKRTFQEVEAFKWSIEDM